MRLFSFNLAGDFGVFSDPSVTTSQMTYLIPSKSALMGVIGAVLGLKRSSTEKEAYYQSYLDLLSSTKVGLEITSNFQKVIFGTNHTTLKRSKKILTKPIKAEVLLNPSYTVFVKTSKEYAKPLEKTLSEHSFFFTPYLGHAYCIARIANFNEYDARAKQIGDDLEVSTSTVVIDEYPETDTKLRGDLFVQQVGEAGELVIERHLHHYLNEGGLKKLVLRHYIPINTMINVEFNHLPRFNEFAQIGDKVVALF